MHYHGGVETRVTNFIKVLNKDFNIFVIMPTERNHYKPVFQIPGVFFYFIEDNIYYWKEITTEFIRHIIIRHNISRLEVNVGRVHLAIDYQLLSKIPDLKIIAIFHYNNLQSIDFSSITEYVDYSFAVSPKTCSEKYGLLRNGVFLQTPIFMYPEEDTARNRILLIGRLDKDKWNSIENCLDFANTHKLSVYIAGNYALDLNNNIKADIHKEFPLVDVEYIGYIDTVDYLIKNYNQFLFVTGVGQVILEGASLGFPVAVSSTLKKQGLTFITNKNILDCAYYNFANIESSKTLQEDFHKIQTAHLDEFDLRESLKKDFDIEKLGEWYKNNCLLDNK